MIKIMKPYLLEINAYFKYLWALKAFKPLD